MNEQTQKRLRSIRSFVAALLLASAAGCSFDSRDGANEAAKASVEPIAPATFTQGEGAEPEKQNASAALEALSAESKARQAAGFEFFYLSHPLDSWAHVAEVSSEAVARSPAWKDDEQNPPLSARKALELADAYVRKEYEPLKLGGIEWRRATRGITLMPFVPNPEDSGDAADIKDPKGRWLWAVTYVWCPVLKNGAFEGELPHIVVPVLMDGTVVPVARDGEAAKHPVGTGIF